MAKLIDNLTRYLRSAGYSLYLYSPLGMRSSRHRPFVLSGIPQHFGYQPVKPELPKISIDEICQPGPIELIEIQPKDGNVSVLELMVLAKLIVRFQPRRIFEIGTFDGRSSLNMAINAPDATVFTLDLPRSEMGATNLRIENSDKTFIDKSASGVRFANSEHGHRIVQLYGDSATFDFSPYAGSIDLIFVDGAHSFEYAMKDSASALRMLADRGVIVWHDYTAWSGVTRGLNHLYREDRQLRWVEDTSLAVRLPNSGLLP